MYVDGEWIEARSGRRFEVTDPATEDALGTIAMATEADVNAALKAAQEGFAVWRRNQATRLLAIAPLANYVFARSFRDDFTLPDYGL